ncbi:hypothetical protein [Lentzea sp. NPDC004782]|uniref:hypothetical protein n=1 Tax=Lentzea sp. NPDC004782 TaxID=3154458 RepID=UPI00339F64D3
MSGNKKRALAVMALATALCGFAVPASASADGWSSCSKWNDRSTYGVNCSGNYDFQYQASARCSNGQYYFGPLKRNGSGESSYVYCSTYGAYYVEGSGQVVIHHG